MSRVSASQVWKVLGLAGLAGVAATGVVVARTERRRQALSPDDVRERLHARHAAAASRGAQGTPAAPAPGRLARLRHALRRRPRPV